MMNGKINALFVDLTRRNRIIWFLRFLFYIFQKHLDNVKIRDIMLTV